MRQNLSAPAALVRRHDPDRFLATLFAPPAVRETLFVLYAFNHEIARAAEVASEPALALLRLAWWREVVEGALRYHEVAAPLASLLAAGGLERDLLLALIEAREHEVNPEIPTLPAWRDHLFATAGNLAVAAGRVLGQGDAAPALARFGAVYGAAGALRSIPFQARRGRVLLPADLLARHGLSPAEVAAVPDAPALLPVRRALAAEALSWLTEARTIKLPRAALPAALPAVLAGRDLRRSAAPARPRGFGARLALSRAALIGRI
ncbi:MAG: squalene/phytoene synthase family protein [Acetobacteraceae bacterium]